MSRQMDLDQTLSRWMGDGPSAVRHGVIDAALEETRHTRQRGARFAPWRYLTMTAAPLRREGRSFAPVLAAAALLMAVAVGGFLLVRPDIGIGDAEHGLFGEDDLAVVILSPDEKPAGTDSAYTFGDVSALIAPIHFVDRPRVGGQIMLSGYVDAEAVTFSGDEMWTSVTSVAVLFETPAGAESALAIYRQHIETSWAPLGAEIPTEVSLGDEGVLWERDGRGGETVYLWRTSNLVLYVGAFSTDDRDEIRGIAEEMNSRARALSTRQGGN